MNKQKRKRFYQRHGIKFNKTIRKRQASLSVQVTRAGTAREYDGDILLYENYKEPLKPIEKNKGYGYYGTLAMTADRDFIQCHICGNLYMNLGVHLRLHKVTARRYREIYGLSDSTALLSEPQREKMQAAAVSRRELSTPGLPIWLQEYNKKVQTGEVVHHGNNGRNGWVLEKRNKEGTCPDQVLEKIRELADSMGRMPTSEEFDKHYEKRYMSAIIYQHGSWTEAVHKLGKRTAAELRQPDSEQLLEDLRAFQKKHKRIPMTSDFNRGLLRDKGVYHRLFGTLNNARIEAGMNAVIPLPFGKIIELTPEQYFEYKAGHGLSKDAQKARANRQKRREIFDGLR